MPYPHIALIDAVAVAVVVVGDDTLLPWDSIYSVGEPFFGIIWLRQPRLNVFSSPFGETPLRSTFVVSGNTLVTLTIRGTETETEPLRFFPFFLFLIPLFRRLCTEVCGKSRVTLRCESACDNSIAKCETWMKTPRIWAIQAALTTILRLYNERVENMW